MMAAFTPGNLVIYRVGDGSAALTSAGTAVFLDEYTPTGSLVQSVAMPTTVAGANAAFVGSGTATSEGLLTNSVDGRYLTLTGYNTAVGTASITSSASAAIPRVVARVDGNGVVDTTTALTDFSTGSNPRSAVSTNGTDIWVTGGAGGPRYATFGSTTSTQVSTTVTNLRHLNIFSSQLYVTTASGSAVRLGAIGTGTPTTAGQTITNLPGIPSSTGNPYGFYMADFDAGVAGIDTLYLADDTSGVTKYSLVGGNWTSNGTIAGATVGLTALQSGATTITLYATRTANTFASLTDSSGYNGAFTGTFTSLASAGTNTAFRGIAVAPIGGAANTPPTVDNVADIATRSYVATAVTNFNVGDVQTAPGALTVTATSNNQSVVPNANITLGGSGAARTISVLPAAGSGTATITITVTDGGSLMVTDTFVVTVNPAPTLSISQTVSGAPGASVQIPVFLNTNGIPGAPIRGIDVVALYDTNVLTIDSVVLGAGLVTQGGWLSSANFVTDPGKISLVFTTTTNFITTNFNGQIGVINATIKPTAPLGASPVNMVKTSTINGSTKTTWVNDDADPSLLLGPVPTAATNDALNDGIVTVNNNVAPVNTAPAGPVLGTEDTNLPLTGPNLIQVTDPDPGNVTTTISVPTGDGTFNASQGAGTATVTFLNGGSTVQFVGPPTQVNAALQTLIFVPLLNRYTTTLPTPTPVVVTVATNDGSVTDTDTFNITLIDINDAPAVVADTLPAVNEDAAPIIIPTATLLANDNKGAPNESDQTLTITGVSNPVGGTVTFDGVNVTFTPTPNFSGAASFTYSIIDNGTNGGMPSPLPSSGGGTVSITINPVNDIPVFVPGSNQVRPFGTNTPQTVLNWATAISAGGGEAQTLTFNVTGNTNPGLFQAGGGPAVNSTTGTLTFTPTGASGTATITLVLQDNGGTANGGVDATAPITFTITINAAGNAPTIGTINFSPINEDAGLQNVPFTGVTDGADGAQQAITITASSNNTALIPNPTVSYSSPDGNGSLNFTPATNSSGTATITVTVVDSGIDLIPGNADDLTTTTTFLVTVNPVNDRPSFTAANPPAVNEDASPQSVAGFVSAFNPGPGNDAGQSVTSYNVSAVSNPALFLVAPAVATNGTLTYQLNPNANGSSTFDLTVTDNGGAANGGLATSLPQTFTITVNPVNDAPTIAVGANQTVAYNSPAQSVAGFASVTSVGPGNETGQTVTYNITGNSNSALFLVAPAIASNGTLSYTPAAGQQGTATITVVGQDSGGTANGGNDLSAAVTFTITVSPPTPNAPPTINVISDVTINEGAPLQTINLSGISDGGDNPAQGVTVTAVSSNPTLVPISVNYSYPSSVGSLTFTSPVNDNGSAIVTVTVRDSGLDLIAGNGDDGSTVRTFNVTVNAVNDVPTFALGASPTVNEDAGAQTIAGFANSISAGPSNESGQTLSFNILGNSTPSLFAVAPAIAANGTLTFTPAANAFGSATIIVNLQDNGGTANGGVDTSTSQIFTITVNSVNDSPSFVIGPNRTTPNTSGAQSLAGQATAISAGPANEAGQTVTFSITGNTNAALFSVQPTIAANGLLTYTPTAGAAGTATISVAAVDNGGTANGGANTSASQSFTITILNNNPPTISLLPDLTINENAGPQLVSLSGITAGGESQAISVTAVSNNPALIANSTISYATPAATGALTYAAVPAGVGSATITVTVRDAGFDGVFNTADDGVTTEPFMVTVLAVNDPPVANDQTLPALMDTPISGVLTASDPDGPGLSYGIVMNSVLGSITFFNAATGLFTYTPASGATGLDFFTFSVTDGEHTDTGIVRIAIQGAQPVVTPSGGDLLVIGTPNPDMIIITYVSAGVVRVRTDIATAHYPVTNQLIVNSGQGDDYVVVTNVLVPTTIDLAEGNDYASSGMQDDLIIGGAGNDQINASGGTNIVWGDAVGEQDLTTGGQDVLSALGGNDILYGGGAKDEIYSGSGDDYVNAGMGDDTVGAGAGNDRVYGNGGNDSLYGDEGDDVITGGAGGDTLVGRTGEDILIGGAGADTLNGDDGRDLLFGGNTTNSASSTPLDANDLALMAMLASWVTSHPAGLASGVTAGNDGAADSLLGYTGDDDFYVNANDATSDFGLPYMGDDRFFTA